jgi:hemerythrin
MGVAFQWSEKLQTGVRRFDEQHKKLISMVNELHMAMSAGKGKEVLLKTINGLIKYTVEHFDDEEKAMLANKYELYNEHKTEHEDLKLQVGEFMKKYNEDIVTTIELYEFLVNWVSKHILVTDKKYGPFLKNV